MLGTLGKPIFDMDFILATASATPNRWADGVYSRPFTVEEIHQIVEAFAKTAKLCMDAGVDGIEVHAVHEGYTLDQFALKYTNQRTDEYGGSLENRYRFAAEIVQAIKAATAARISRCPCATAWCPRPRASAKAPCPRRHDYVEVGRDMAESRDRGQVPPGRGLRHAQLRQRHL